MKKFTVIVPHYDKSISDKDFLRGMESLNNQTFKDFEILLYHDGPASRSIPDISHISQVRKIEITEKRIGDWGHSLRDKGIKESEGEWIVHFNPDNVLYPNALEEVNRVSNLSYEKYPCINIGRIIGKNNIIIMPIKMRGHFIYGLDGLTGIRVKELADNHWTIFTGFPAQYSYIDCMQLVMKKDLWMSYGGWYDKHEAGDGMMYHRFVQEHGARYCGEILGEHW